MNYNNQTPLVSLTGAFLGGVKFEKTTQAGLTHLLLKTWPCGTKRITEEKLNFQLESQASYLTPVGGRDGIGLKISGLSRFGSELLYLFKNLMEQPLLSRNVIDREKLLIKENLKKQMDQPAYMAFLDFEQKMFPHHPYGYPFLGTPDSLDSVTQNSILNHLKKIQTQNRAFVISGNFNKNEVLDVLVDLIQKWSLKECKNKAVILKKLSRDETSFRFLKKEQNHILYGFRGLCWNSKYGMALDVIEAVLSGQGGRLFSRLRKSRIFGLYCMPYKKRWFRCGLFWSLSQLQS